MTLLNDRYHILKPLATGGFGETFLAQDTLSQQPCVLKRLKSSEQGDRVEVEIQSLYQLGHLTQQVPALLDHFMVDQSLYLVQEFIDGHDLTKELDQEWDEQSLLQMLRDLLSLLNLLHSHHIIHGDIKPRNIIRCKNGQLALIDFGAAQFVLTPNTSSRIVGTTGYMPNEQHAGRSRYSSDIYALGMVAIQCLTKIHPKDLEEDERTGEMQWQSPLRPHFTHILKKMIKVRVKERYATATEVLLDLERLGKTRTQLFFTNLNPSALILLAIMAGVVGIALPVLPVVLQVVSLVVPGAIVLMLKQLRLW